MRKKYFNARFFFPPRAIKNLVAATTSREKIAVGNFFFRKSPYHPSFVSTSCALSRSLRSRDMRPRIRRFWKIKFIAFAARAATRCIIGCRPTKRRKYITSAGSPGRRSWHNFYARPRQLRARRRIRWCWRTCSGPAEQNFLALTSDLTRVPTRSLRGV